MNYIEEKYFFTRGKAILFGIILIAIITFIIILLNKKSNVNNEYKDFEKELRYAAENYVIINEVKLKNGEEKRIQLRELDKNNFVFSDLKDKCKGYVIVSKEKNKSTDNYEIIYTSYIRCGNKYITSNYSEY